MEILTLTPEQYGQFLEDSRMAYNFMQSMPFVNYMKAHDEIEIYGGAENGKLLYALPVIFRPAMKLFKYASSLREWVAANPKLLQDETRLQDFVAGVSAKLKQKKAIVWLVESSIEYQQHDRNGNVLEDGFQNEDYREMLTRIGFEKGCLWRGYDESRQSRWVSWIDLQKNMPETSHGYPMALANGLEEYTWQELLKEMAGNTRRSFQKTDLPYIVTVRKDGTEDFDLTDFDELLEASAEKHHFGVGSKEHRKDLVRSFGNHGYVSTAYLDVEAYENFLNEKEAEFTAKEQAAMEVCEKMPNSKKKRNQLLEIQEQKNHNEKEIAALAELKQTEPRKRIPLASGIFLETPSEMIYLFGGSNPALARYMGPYANQKEMIRLALDHGLQRYNFWGISGNFQPEEEGYGVYFFKKNLGATVGEYCGEFYLILNNVFGKLFLDKIRPDRKQA